MGHMHGTLSSLGIRQSKDLAKKLSKVKFNHIYSSDLGRCVATAEFIKKYHPDTELTFTKRLREFDFGKFQGKERDTVNKNLDILLSDTSKKLPEGESINDLQARLKFFISKVYSIYPNGTVLFVTHSTFLKNAISIYLKLPIIEIQKKVHVKNASMIILDFTSGSGGSLIDTAGVSVDDSNIKLL